MQVHFVFVFPVLVKFHDSFLPHLADKNITPLLRGFLMASCAITTCTKKATDLLIRCFSFLTGVAFFVELISVELFDNRL